MECECFYFLVLFELCVSDYFLTSVVLLNYREDGVTPYITIWKAGLQEMKV